RQLTCGGGRRANVCRAGSCTPESNTGFCSRLGKNCGSVTAADNCGQTRTVSSCGSCTSPETCGGGGTANVCGASAGAPVDCNTVSYQGPITISAGGTYTGNWESTNYNTPAVNITTNQPVTINNSCIRSKGHGVNFA